MNPPKVRPFLASLHHRLLQLGRVGMEPNRVGIQRVDLNCSFELLDEDLRGDFRYPDSLGERPVYEVHAHAAQLVAPHGLHIRIYSRVQPEQTRRAGNSTARNENRTWDEDGVEEVPGYLAMGFQLVDGTDGVLIVGIDGGKKEVNGGKDI